MVKASGRKHELTQLFMWDIKMGVLSVMADSGGTGHRVSVRNRIHDTLSQRSFV